MSRHVTIQSETYEGWLENLSEQRKAKKITHDALLGFNLVSLTLQGHCFAKHATSISILLESPHSEFQNLNGKLHHIPVYTFCPRVPSHNLKSLFNWFKYMVLAYLWWFFTQNQLDNKVYRKKLHSFGTSHFPQPISSPQHVFFGSLARNPLMLERETACSLCKLGDQYVNLMLTRNHIHQTKSGGVQNLIIKKS